MSERKVCIITGANAGIGRAAAGQIAGRGYHVILACRNAERAAGAKSEIESTLPDASVEVGLVDMGIQASVRRFAAEVMAAHAVVDVIIHNAAAFDVSQKERVVTEEGIEMVWAVDHVGPVLLTELLMPALRRSANGRVITVSSKGLLAMPRLKVDAEDPEFERRRFSVTRAYYQAKRAQVIYTYWLADRLAGTSMTANCVRVTAVKIDLSRYPNLSAFRRRMYSLKSRMSITPEEMAETYTWLATSEEAAQMNGCYFDENHAEVRSAPYTYEPDTIRSVMELTARYVPEISEVLSNVTETTDR